MPRLIGGDGVAFARWKIRAAKATEMKAAMQLP
jgi:hypothetical protein